MNLSWHSPFKSLLLIFLLKQEAEMVLIHNNTEVKKLRYYARRQRQDATDVERILWGHLRAHRLNGLKFKRQVPVGNYIVDFLCYQKKVIVELDGGQHLEQARYDQKRTLFLERSGFQIIRFWNHDVWQHLETVLNKILHACHS